MVITAVEQHYPLDRRLLHDDLAIEMLPPSMRWVVRLTRWGALRGFLVKASEKSAPGIWGSITGRKRYIDDELLAALRAGTEAVVILGAGLDTRGRRLVPAVFPVFEVDPPVNIDGKRKRISLPDNVKLVPIDFEREDLAVVLEEHGYDVGTRTVFVWEGVTQYLTEPAVRSTFEFLAKASRESRFGVHVRAQGLPRGRHHVRLGGAVPQVRGEGTALALRHGS
ncbi:SAM-dependent methyltransferase [Lentzea sp. NBRC 105346]|uniref:SAM-dependent methyltransferase n=1 Tax=Lentzea sp. NBRC 105346 TaxID=3032205 RepID=UPI00255754A2|nr:SAM-dependent methyltransferase [Lentzea sp. NBRC 105346]